MQQVATNFSKLLKWSERQFYPPCVIKFYWSPGISRSVGHLCGNTLKNWYFSSIYLYTGQWSEEWGCLRLSAPLRLSVVTDILLSLRCLLCLSRLMRAARSSSHLLDQRAAQNTMEYNKTRRPSDCWPPQLLSLTCGTLAAILLLQTIVR